MEVKQPPVLADYPRKSYIYTLPKSGTYLWGVLLETLGMTNTGYHLSVWKYLDTKAHEKSVNTQTPSQTAVKSVYVRTLKKLQPGEFCFGHLCPMFFPNGIINRNFKVLCSFRRPREILVSEFIDFRYRRNDVAFVSQDNIPDPIQAFEQYLTQHGKVIKEICLQFLVLRSLKQNPFYKEMMGDNLFFEIDYGKFMDETSGPEIVENLVRFLKPKAVSQIDAKNLWNQVLSQDNKTKSSGLKLPFDKADLWTAGNDKIFNQLGFDHIEAYLLGD